ncbi:hypothetical protein Aperf_G00000021446 [Anoplocephala perfoliata]
MSNSSAVTTENPNEDKWYESTLPIVLAIVLSVILVILIIIRIVQGCQQWKVHRSTKKAKAKKRSEEDGPEEGQDAIDRTSPAVTAKRESKSKAVKKYKSQEDQISAQGAPIVPSSENGSLLQSGVRAHPTRKAENKSWYDSKLIPFIDEADVSLDNLYLPENAIHEVV